MTYIVDFLEERIKEDEDQANAVHVLASGVDNISSHELPEFMDYAVAWQPTRVLAECAFKREAIETYEAFASSPDTVAVMPWLTLRGQIRRMAQVYKDHPDYQET